MVSMNQNNVDVSANKQNKEGTVSISVGESVNVPLDRSNFRVDKIKSESKQTHHPGATVVHGYVK